MRFLRLYELKLTLPVVRRHFSTEAEKVDFRPTRMHVPAFMEHNFKTSFGDPPQALLGEQETWRHLDTAHHVIHPLGETGTIVRPRPRTSGQQNEHAFTGLFGPCRVTTEARITRSTSTIGPRKIPETSYNHTTMYSDQFPSLISESQIEPLISPFGPQALHNGAREIPPFLTCCNMKCNASTN